jgi:hypothetical protein
VSVIDMKYWWYTANGGRYDPKGGESLAPRQQLRAWKGSKSRSDASLARQVREYRARYSDKAVLCSLSPADGWAVVAAGGSVPNLPPTTDARLLAALPAMKPFAAKGLSEQQWALAESGRNYLVCSLAGETIQLALADAADAYAAYWVDRRTGEPRPTGVPVSVAGKVTFRIPDARPVVLWITRKQ